MLTPTHLITAQTAYLGGCIAVGHPPALAEALVAMAAGIAPDLDHRQGLIGRYVPVISGPLEHWFGHRTFTHSLILQLAVLIPAFLWLPFGYALALLAGLVSHSVADMMTESEVCWFWPSRVRCVLPGNDRYRVSLMSWGKLSFLVLMAGAGLGFQAVAQLNAGTAGLIRTAIGSIAAAREQYDAEKGATAYRLRIEGRDNRTFATIEGEYPVVGEWQSAGFLKRRCAICWATRRSK